MYERRVYAIAIKSSNFNRLEITIIFILHIKYLNTTLKFNFWEKFMTYNLDITYEKEGWLFKIDKIRFF